MSPDPVLSPQRVTSEKKKNVLKDFETQLASLCDCKKKTFALKNFRAAIVAARRRDELDRVVSLVKSVVPAMERRAVATVGWEFRSHLDRGRKEFLLEHIEDLSLTEMSDYCLFETSSIRKVLNKVDCYDQNLLWYFPEQAFSLVSLGLNVNHVNSAGQTVLFHKPGYSESFRSLGIDVGVRDYSGRTAFQYYEKTTDHAFLIDVLSKSVYSYDVVLEKLQEEKILDGRTWELAISFVIVYFRIFALDVIENFLKLNDSRLTVPCALLHLITLRLSDCIERRNLREKFPEILNLKCSKHEDNLLIVALENSEDEVAIALLEAKPELLDEPNVWGNSARTIVELEKKHLVGHLKHENELKKLQCICANSILSSRKRVDELKPKPIREFVESHCFELLL